MADSDAIRALLIEADAHRAILTRGLLDQAGAGLVQLLHVEQLGSALEILASEPFDVILLRRAAPGDVATEDVGRLMLQAPGVPIIVMALLAEADLALPMIRDGAQDYWVNGRDTGELLLRAMRHAIERNPRLERLSRQANYDLLTDLPNRYLFEDRLAHAAARARRQNRPLALLYLDVDGFKRVNDRLGHCAGDNVLRTIARRLTGVVREADTVARLGGDEFAVVLESLARVEDAAAVALKVLATLATPFFEEDRRFDLTCSVGISFFPLDGNDATTLLDHADRAMYRAKQLGGNRYRRFHGEPGSAGAEPVQGVEAPLRRQHPGLI